MTIFVEPLGDRELHNVRAVSVEPDTILHAEIVDGADDEVYVWGDAAGEGKLEVEVFGGGEIYSDIVTLRVAEVDSVAMKHSCSDYSDAAYLVGDAPSLLFDREDAAGTKLVGEAQSSSDPRNSCQVLTGPAFYQDRVYCDEAGLHFWPIEDLGEVYVDLIDAVDVVSSRFFREIDIHVIDPFDLNFTEADGVLRTGVTRNVELNPVTYFGNSHRPVCTHLELYVEVLTPYFCSGRTGDLAFYTDADDANEIPLRGNNAGTCAFAVELANRPDLGEWIFSAEVRE